MRYNNKIAQLKGGCNVSNIHTRNPPNTPNTSPTTSNEHTPTQVHAKTTKAQSPTGQPNPVADGYDSRVTRSTVQAQARREDLPVDAEALDKDLPSKEIDWDQLLQMLRASAKVSPEHEKATLKHIATLLASRADRRSFPQQMQQLFDSGKIDKAHSHAPSGVPPSQQDEQRQELISRMSSIRTWVADPHFREGNSHTFFRIVASVLENDVREALELRNIPTHLRSQLKQLLGLASQLKEMTESPSGSQMYSQEQIEEVREQIVDLAQRMGLIDNPPSYPTGTNTEFDAYIEELESKLQIVSDDAQLANVDLQNILSDLSDS